ncbi:hypothetical protein MferCBS31731_006069 [Microsporum ferrugineum]
MQHISFIILALLPKLLLASVLRTVDTLETTTTSETSTTPTISPTKTTITTSMGMTTTTTAGPPSPTLPNLAKDCDNFHLVASGDSCYTVQTKYGISADQLMMWNPSLNTECSNLWLGYYACVHVPGATTSVPTPTPTPKGPQPQMPGIVDNCEKFYLIKDGDSCYTINQATSTTLEQLRSWNKNINEDCSNIWLGYYVCVGV